MVAQLCEYTETTELYTLKQWICWYMSYISIFLKFKLVFEKKNSREEPSDSQSKKGGRDEIELGEMLDKIVTKLKNFVFEMFTEHLLCAGQHSRHLGYINEQRSLPAQTYIQTDDKWYEKRKSRVN